VLRDDCFFSLQLRNILSGLVFCFCFFKWKITRISGYTDISPFRTLSRRDRPSLVTGRVHTSTHERLRFGDYYSHAVLLPDRHARVILYYYYCYYYLSGRTGRTIARPTRRRCISRDVPAAAHFGVCTATASHNK